MLTLSLLPVGIHRPGAGSASRQAALRSKALQLLPAFLQLPAPAKAPIMDAVAAVVDSFPVFSREAEGTTQHQAYLAQLFALFDALWGAADQAYDFIAVLEVRIKPPSIPHRLLIDPIHVNKDCCCYSRGTATAVCTCGRLYIMKAAGLPCRLTATY